MTSLPNRFYHWIRDPSARSLAAEEQIVRGFEHLRGHKYCLLVTYRRNGGGGTDARVVRARRPEALRPQREGRRQGQAHPQRSTSTCRPLHGARQAARAARRWSGRVLDQPGDEQEAEAALSAHYGLGRKVYEGAGGALGAETVYLEITPA